MVKPCVIVSVPYVVKLKQYLIASLGKNNNNSEDLSMKEIVFRFHFAC